uniref:Reverse transcriptase Ty1/copia-type domain-containing protein n=1 Tax=Fagus sylvatica TaxID=28930 RepID=A0A2N9ENB5_FAGSY
MCVVSYIPDAPSSLFEVPDSLSSTSSTDDLPITLHGECPIFARTSSIDRNLERYDSWVFLYWSIDQYEKFRPFQPERYEIDHFALYQLNIKRVFLHGDLQEVYMDQPPRYVIAVMWAILREAMYGLKQSPRVQFDRFSFVVLELGITDLKRNFGQQFHTKDLGALRYFLGIEVARSSQGISLFQRKYVFDLLSETRLLSAPLVDTQNSTVKLDGNNLVTWCSTQLQH